MLPLDFDPSSLRDWMAGVGLLRIVSETSKGCMQWRMDRGRHRLLMMSSPEDLAAKCVNWIAEHRSAFEFATLDNVVLSPDAWRQQAEFAQGLESALWCALGSDAVMHRDGKKIQASKLESAHGGGHQHWLRSMRDALAIDFSAKDFDRLLTGRRRSVAGQTICRWDPECDRPHAYRAKAPGPDKMSQDQTVNALAAIGLASCPSAPTRKGLATPIVVDPSIRRHSGSTQKLPRAGGDGSTLEWPIWTDAIRISDLEAALCCGHGWPIMTGRRWLQNQLYCFSRGRLREPQAAPKYQGGSYKGKSV